MGEATHELNALGQPVGPLVPDWKPPPVPPREPLQGRFCRLEPLDPSRHARSLFEANQLDRERRNWTYLSYGPFETFDSYLAWLTRAAAGADPMFFAIIDAASQKAAGVAAYLRIDPAAGSIEVGSLNFSPLLQRRPAATEAMVLMMERAFSLGYRRYEWKTNALNAASRRAAQRLGFSFEGVFRQAAVHKGRNRDTVWYAVIDRDWPQLQAALRRWLDPANFDADGRQRVSLASLTAPLVERRG